MSPAKPPKPSFDLILMGGKGRGGGGAVGRGWQHVLFLTGIEVTQMSSAYQICLVFIGVLSFKTS